MPNWLLLSIPILVAWGIFGLFSKLALQHLDPRSVLIFQELGALIVVLAVAASVGFRPELHPMGVTFAMLSAGIGALGGILFLFVLKSTKASVAVPVTSLYPVVTVLLSVLVLHESISFKQGLGIVFAVIALVLFSL